MKTEKNIKNNRLPVLVISVALLLCASTTVTIAFLSDSTNSISNSFRLAGMEIEIEETTDSPLSLKENVCVKNTGEAAAYIRADIIANWRDENGNICSDAPVAGKDYIIELYGAADGWFEKDGFYYYSEPVAPGGETAALIKSCKPAYEKAGWRLQVDIISGAVQSSPAKAVQEAWGITPDSDGRLS